MATTFIENLTTLLEAAGAGATPETVSELTKMAKRMEELGVNAPKPTAQPKADPKESARVKLAALPSELPSGSSDAARLQNAKARAAALAEIYPHLRSADLEANGSTFNFTPRGGGSGEAA